jgi:hypothetical protein
MDVALAVAVPSATGATAAAVMAAVVASFLTVNNIPAP